MGLKLNGAFLDEWLTFLYGGLAIPEIIQRSLVHNQFVVEGDSHEVPQHDDAEGVPLSQWFVGKYFRILSCSSFWVVPQSTRTFASTQIPLPSFLSRVPYLYLRNPPQIDPAVRFCHGFVVHVKLKISVILLSREIKTVTIVNEHPVLDRPVLVNVHNASFLLCSKLVRRKCHPLGRIFRFQSPPSIQILPVEKGNETRGRFWLGGMDGNHSEKRQ